MHYTTLLLSILGATAVVAAPAAQTPANDLLARAAMGGCNQGDCPDNNKTFDLESELRNGQWYYWIRDQSPGYCKSYPTDAGGCANVDSGDRICIDWRSGYGYTVINGWADCFTVTSGYVCDGSKWIASYDTIADCAKIGS